MQEIDVFFQASTGVVRIPQDPVGLHSGDEVLWHVHSTDTTLKWVEIEFATSEFFDSRGGSKSKKRFAKLDHGHGRVMGAAPELPARGSIEDKYEVRGYTSGTTGPQGVPTYRLDPVIIICDP